MYGTHYTTPGYVLYYLVRQCAPLMLSLQAGRFDEPDRLFHSVGEAWRGVCSNTGDLKELIPQFYQLDSPGGAGAFLRNAAGLELGTRQDGAKLNNVVLPPWANDAADFFV